MLLLSRQHHMLVTWLRAPAQHCAAHHPGELWRQVAARVAERVQVGGDEGGEGQGREFLFRGCKLAARAELSRSAGWTCSSS